MPFIFAGIVLVLSLLIILLIPGLQKGLIITGFSLSIPAVIVYLGRIFASGNSVYTSISETSLSTLTSGENGLPVESITILSQALDSIFQTIYVDILEKAGLYCIILIAIGTLLAIIGVSLGSKKSTGTGKRPPATKSPKSQKTNPDTSLPDPKLATPDPKTPQSLPSTLPNIPKNQAVATNNQDLESIMPKNRPSQPAAPQPPPVNP